MRGDPTRLAMHPALASVRGAQLLGGLQATEIHTVIRLLARTRPDAVINCVGVIKQLDEAKDPQVSIAINSLYPHCLADCCRAVGARLLHISTDCVFSGRRGGYRESDQSDAEDLYGRSKFLGEVGGPGALTLRTSIVGRELHSHVGLFDWFIKQRGKTVNGYARATYTGFTTLEMAAVIGRVLREWTTLEGVYQVASAPISKYDLLTLLNDALSLGITLHRDDKFVCDRSLDGSRFAQATGYTAPSWPAMIQQLAADATPYAG